MILIHIKVKGIMIKCEVFQEDFLIYLNDLKLKRLKSKIIGHE